MYKRQASRVEAGLKTTLRQTLGLEDESHLGWFVKALNAVALVCAFAITVTSVAVGTFYSAPPSMT